MKTWMDLNEGWKHKLLTDELIAGYVAEHFHARNPDIEETFLQAKDFVLQLDLIKYMVLWAEGGVYSDLDVACVKPVREWVPERFIDKAGIVLGVQVEQMAEGDGDAEEEFRLADWTIMSKPNQPFLWFLYQRFTENIKHLAAEQVVLGSNKRPYNVSDVTGRNALTQAFLAYATSVTATKVTVDNFTEVAEPTLFGEVLVLPVQAFASSHRNRRELVHHYEAGSWKSEPWDKVQPSVNEEQMMKEPEQNEVVEEGKDVEAENQKQEDMKTTGGDQDEKGGASEEEENTPGGSRTSSTTSDKPPSVQYENAQAKDKPTTNDEPPSVQYENLKVAQNVTQNLHNTTNSTSQHSTNDNTNDKDATDKDTETKSEDETKAKEEAENLKAQAAAQALEQEKKDAAAAAKELAEAQKKEEEGKKAAEAEKKKEEEEKKAAEAQKRKEEEEEENEKKKKAAEPKWAPLNEAGRLTSSNNLADYGAEFVPDE